MKFTLTSAFALCTAICAAAVFEKAARLPQGWEYVEPAKADDIVKLTIALREQNIEAFEQLVIDISTPDHHKYGQHLESHEIEALVRPHEDAAVTARRWLMENDITSVREDGSWIDFWTTASIANDLLDTKFAWYYNAAHDRYTLRTTEYSLPEDVASHVSFISPTTKFPSLKPLKSELYGVGSHQKAVDYATWALEHGYTGATAPPTAVCAETITPQCLLELYNVHYGASATNSKTSYASFLNEYARYTDLTVFETAIAPYANGKNFTVIQYNGGGNDQTSTNDSTEANLDNQYMIGVAYPVPVTEFSTGGCGPLVADPNEPAGACDNEPYMDFLKGIMAMKTADLPQTLSVSYGEDEESWPQAMATSVCTMFSKLGARGVSVLFASGDSGPGAICENNAGTKAQYVPAFPAGCPFVTAVGATQSIPETVASFSGGGFSNYFSRPGYQKAQVTKYLSTYPAAYKQYLNQSGRGYPDVAAQGVNFLVVNDGVTEPVDGTSAASPTFASIVALLNSARISSGQKPLGFLNPFLYSKGFKGLNDITTGGSTGCSNIAGAGFNATTGWDAATGLGTPDFGKLLALTSPTVSNTGGVIAA